MLKSLGWKKEKSNTACGQHHKIRVLYLYENRCLTEDQFAFLADVNDFNIEARYPDAKFSFYQTCTKEFTEGQFSMIKEMYKWLLSQMK